MRPLPPRPRGRPRLVGHLVVDELVADYEGGLSAAAIARKLNAEGVPGPAGGRWHPFTVSRLIRERLGLEELPRRRTPARRGALRSSRTPPSG
ncbi:MAG TPA: recombinase family protein [Candidatus Dormibacteraeota bacterium]|nr:recombinase family protein [Candidatus Dormibacteraeota bacterium]